MSTQSSSPTELDALNLHGVFLKKRVLKEISSIPGMGVFAEEFGVAFHEPTAIDIISRDGRSHPTLLFVLECKRAYVRQKKWIFFRDDDRKFRACRRVSAFGQSGNYADNIPSLANCHICSEGYEINSKKNSAASPEPIYRAANQLSSGYLGFVKLRIEQRTRGTRSDDVDTIIPVLVTTATIEVAEFAASDISLTTGNLASGLSATAVDWLVLKHPFAVPPVGDAGDFRRHPSCSHDWENWKQQFRESIFVVRADKLRSFFSQPFRDYLYGLK